LEGTEGGERVWEGKYNANTVYIYVNEKMIPVKTIPDIGGGGLKRVLEGVN
jgi:hypothetical protein